MKRISIIMDDNTEKVWISAIQLDDDSVIKFDGPDSTIMNKKDINSISFEYGEQIQILHYILTPENSTEFNFMNYGLVREYSFNDNYNFSIMYSPIE